MTLLFRSLRVNLIEGVDKQTSFRNCCDGLAWWITIAFENKLEFNVTAAKFVGKIPSWPESCENIKIKRHFKYKYNLYTLKHSQIERQQ